MLFVSCIYIKKAKKSNHEGRSNWFQMGILSTTRVSICRNYPSCHRICHLQYKMSFFKTNMPITVDSWIKVLPSIKQKNINAPKGKILDMIDFISLFFYCNLYFTISCFNYFETLHRSAQYSGLSTTGATIHKSWCRRFFTYGDSTVVNLFMIA